MKKLLVITTVAIIFGSCGKAEITKLNSTKDSLSRVVAMKDSIINDAFLNIDQIASTLSQISERENIVTQNTSGELTKSKKEQIADNIVAISDLLEKNKSDLSKLNATAKKLQAAGVEIGGLKKLVASLEKQIEDKNRQIDTLTAQLESMGGEIKTLTTSLKGLKQEKEELEAHATEQSTKIDEQTTKINTIQYIIGSETELMAKNIIDKKGFIGRTKTIGSNISGLIKSDIRNIERIAIGHKKVTIITNHPDDSYMLTKDSNNMVEELVITDKDKFWSNSKILIVSYK